MLTALSIENRQGKNAFARLFNLVRGNSAYASINSARGVALRHVHYINRTGKVDWNRLGRIIDSGRKGILCSDEVVFPEDSGFTRFENGEFKSRLCVNLGLFVENRLGGRVPLAFYDPRGENTALIKDVVSCCGDVTVVTDNLTLYNERCEELTGELGASVHCSENRALLGNCPLVLAPTRINGLLPLSDEAVVLTSAPPTVCVHGFVYFDYSFRMPNFFDRIKPDDLSEEYFAGALYSRAYQRELGSIVPTSCSNLTSSQTASSIEKYLLRKNAVV